MDITSFKNQLAKARTLDELNKAVKYFLHLHSISTFAFTVYLAEAGSHNKIKYDFVSDNIRAWHEYYLTQNFEEVDSDLKKARQTILPIYWELKTQLNKAKTFREKQLRKDSNTLKVKVEEGLSIPIHGPNGEFAILLLEQCRGEKGLEDYQQKEVFWLAIAYTYYHFLRQHLITQPSKQSAKTFSPRELECLRLSAQGLTAHDIAIQLGITSRTVHFHWQNIHKKLGTRNKSQAIHLAQMKALL